MAAPVFLKELEWFVRGVLEYDPRLKDEVYEGSFSGIGPMSGQENRFPRVFFFPAQRRLRANATQAEEGLQRVADRERRMEEQARKAREQAEKAIKK